MRVNASPTWGVDGAIVGAVTTFIDVTAMRAEDAREVGEALLARLIEPFEVVGQGVTLTASLGVSVDPTDALSAPDLQRHADTAINRAKDRGKNRLVFFREPS